MSKVQWLAVCGLLSVVAVPAAARAQMRAQGRPYIGFVYPAGGQQGTTFQVRLGGQGLDDVDEAFVSGDGVQAKILQYYRKLGPQEMTLLREQLAELRRGPAGEDEATRERIASIQKRMSEYVQRPASASISSLVIVEVTMAPKARPGERELRLATPRGVSNPLVFHVGQLPEVARKPMLTSNFQVLGKEELALRKRPPEEAEVRITAPCTVNGQVASGEVNRYRFEARKGQRLVISAAARQLIPYIADAVPGWFQPVLALYDAEGKELAYDDDYRFRPDPVITFEVPRDGEYVFAMTDAIYRGREDFVYRVTVGELPFVTSVFPLGGRVGETVNVQMRGWNLQGAKLRLPAQDAGPGVHQIAARRKGLVSNSVPFALDTLPECAEEESNDDAARAQRVELPTIVNGRVDRTDDWDVFRVAGRAGETLVAEVTARRLDSPLDSTLKLTDATGKVLAFNDDRADVESGMNTHHADSYLMVKLPADGDYFVHLGDTARNGGEEYAYRLRISAPQPDFALRVVPSSLGLRGGNASAVSVFAIRKDGFAGPIKLALKDPPAGFSSPSVSLSANQPMARLSVRTNLRSTEQPVSLAIEGRTKIQEQVVTHQAVPAEDRMQAFLWRHLVPAEDLQVLVFDPAYTPPTRRAPPPPVPVENKAAPAPGDTATDKPKFTKQQVAGRLRQLRLLFNEGLLTDDFYAKKVAECEAAQ